MTCNTFAPVPFCQIGDIGVQLVVQVTDQDGNPINLGPATDLKIKIGYPDGTTVDKGAIIFTDGYDGKLVYRTITNDLTQTGTHRIQAKVTLGGAPKHSKVGLFEVNENVDNA